MSKTNKIILAVAIAAVVILAAYVLSTKVSAPTMENSGNTQTSTSTAAVNLGTSGGTIEYINGAGEKVSVPALSIEEVNKIPKPNLDRPIIITEKSIPEEQKSQVVEIVKNAIAAVKSDPYSFDKWTKLGMDFKIIGDYKSAEEIWQYVHTVAPFAVAPLANLGSLYEDNVKNYAASENAWKGVIKNDPKYLSGYLGLFNLYHYFYKTDTTLAVDTLKSGIASNPEAIDLYRALAAYYKEKGDNSNALVYYKQALVLAQKVKNTGLVQTLQQEISGLSK